MTTMPVIKFFLRLNDIVVIKLEFNDDNAGHRVFLRLYDIVVIKLEFNDDNAGHRVFLRLNDIVGLKANCPSLPISLTLSLFFLFNQTNFFKINNNAFVTRLIKTVRIHISKCSTRLIF